MKKAALLVVSGLLFCLSAPALQLDHPPRLADLAAKAPVVVRARVLETAAAWAESAEEGRHIRTTAWLLPLETLRGEKVAAPFRVDYPGGTVGGLREELSDGIRLAPGQEALLLLAPVDGAPNSPASGRFNVLYGMFGACETTGGIVRAPDEPLELATLRLALAKRGRLALAQPRVVPIAGSAQALSGVNLKPYKLPTWSAPLVATNVPGTTSDTPSLTDSDSLYLDAAVANTGDTPSGPFSVYLLVDSALYAGWTVSSLANGYLVYWQDLELAALSAGTHTLQLITDPLDQVVEAVEDDNTYNKPMSIAHTNPVSLNAVAPSSGSAGTGAVVVLSGSGFGAAPGSGRVEFFYQTARPKIQAPITAWSDTQVSCTVPIDTILGYPGSAASGCVTLTNGLGQTSNGVFFQVPFSYGGSRWPGDAPNVHYRINENLGSLVGEGGQIQAAATLWNTAGAMFTLTYDGPTTATVTSANDINEILWGAIATPGVLAQASYWFSGETIVETDIKFNTAITWAIDGSSAAYDIQTVAVHELGHWLNLRDLYGFADFQRVMWGYAGQGQVKHSLDPGDRAGIRWIYGAMALCGDVDDDGTVSAADEVALAASLAGSLVSGQPPMRVPERADTNADGQFNCLDLLVLKAYLAGLVPSLPQG